MLPAAHRLSGDLTIKKVAASQPVFFSNYLHLKKRPNKLEVNRFCFVISTKVSKKAIVRNKLKRQLSAIIQKKLTDLKSGFDIMINTKQSTLELSPTDLEKQLIYALQKSKLL